MKIFIFSFVLLVSIHIVAFSQDDDPLYIAGTNHFEAGNVFKQKVSD